MSNPKKPVLTAGLVAKGAAVAAPGMDQRSAVTPSTVPAVSEQTVTLTFRLPPDIQREFKVYAASRGVTMTELFLKMFAQEKASG